MLEKASFIPGRPGVPGVPLSRYRPAQPVQAAAAYVMEFTRPGDLVVDLFCQGPMIVREIVTSGRRALGLSINPLLLVAARLWLSQADADALNSAFTRLADSRKGDVPLRQHLTSLYRSACPSCGGPGIAEWFAWDRDGNYPFRKAVRCSRCEGTQEGATDDADAQSARSIPARGLAYYYALDRVAPPGHTARERSAELVELYTPRNLSALMDLSLRFEALELDEETNTALTAVLLDCFDTGSMLDPFGEERSRPRALRVPSTYIERNIWLCFEECFARLLNDEGPHRGLEGGFPPLRRATDASLLVQGETEGYALVRGAASDIGSILPGESVALVFVDPPWPDAVFWALSALWAGWLWQTPAARAMRPFLRRRRFDWDWHWQVLRTALEATGPVLVPDGHLVTLFSGPDDALLESVCLAASGAGYGLQGWGYSPEVGHRQIWDWAHVRPGPLASVETLRQEITNTAAESIVGVLRERGEPVSGPMLHASAHAKLVECGLLSRAAGIAEDGPSAFALAASGVRYALGMAPVVRLADPGDGEQTLWWLADSPEASSRGLSGVESPLADRIEATVLELLVQQPMWELEELVNALYARFRGPLTPDLALVLTCVDSLSVRDAGMQRLRPEDDPQRRDAELKTLRGDLVKLGKRLGFQVRRDASRNVGWLEEAKEAYVFAISATAALGPHLFPPQVTPEGMQHCLVLPGGRAQLVTFKIHRDPRLAQAVEESKWRFIKFRHLRRLVAEEELDRHSLKTVLGLDPIVEREAAQIPLF